MTPRLSDREQLTPEYLKQNGLGLSREFFDRVVRGMALYIGYDPQTVSPPALTLDTGVEPNIQLADFTVPPFRKMGRGVAGFGNSPANAGNASYVQLINPTDSNVVIVVNNVTYTCPVAVQLFAAWGGVSITLQTPGAGLQPPYLETQAQGTLTGAPGGQRRLALAPLLMISSINPITAAYTQLAAPGAAATGFTYPIGLVMWPGMDMILAGTAVNNAVAASFGIQVYDLNAILSLNIFP